MRWFRIGLYLLAGIAGLLLIGVAVIISIDFGRFKDRIEVEVSNQLGRELRIDGAMHANIGSTIDLHLEDVFLANPDWAEADSFVSVRTEMVILFSYGGILDRQIVISIIQQV